MQYGGKFVHQSEESSNSFAGGSSDSGGGNKTEAEKSGGKEVNGEKSTESGSNSSENGSNSSENGNNSTESGNNSTESGNNSTESGNNSTESGNNSTEGGSNGTSFQNEGLEAHNMFRKIHGTPALKLDAGMSKEAEAYAQLVAKEGKLFHSSSKDGENLAMGCNDRNLEVSAGEAVKDWYAIELIQYISFTCL